MPLKIYNSLTRRKEDFVPLKSGEVKMYVCGPTVYDEAHIGHLRSAYVFDVMRRYLEYSGNKVTFVRNVTDVDDKIIEKARSNKNDNLIQETESVSSKYLKLYHEELKKLGIVEPSTEPRATQHIHEMQSLILKLMDKGMAYMAGQDIYFDVTKFQGYGKLSHQKTDAMLEGVRKDATENKKNSLDFALWKSAKPEEPAWDFMIKGQNLKGRPGWHIECSAMSMKYLGETFDIHGGGLDLIFPHHENEIAQSEAVTGKSFAKYWLHHGLITVNGQKMSKSLKNFTTLQSLAEKDASRIEDLKVLFLKTHYSAPLDYSENEMVMAKSIRQNFSFFFDEAKIASGGKSSPDKFISDKIAGVFKAAMDNNFNTPQVLTDLHDIMRQARETKEAASLLTASEGIRKVLLVLGLKFETSIVNETEILKAIKTRAEAKKNKDFKLADEIRDYYLKQGIEFVDSSSGTTWRKR